MRADAIVARHEARPQVAGGKAGGKASTEAQGEQLLLDMGYSEEELLGASAEDKREMCGRVLGLTHGAIGHEAAAAACLDPKSQGQLALALAQNQPGEVERLRKQARTAFSDKGAAACLDPESQGQLALALAQNQPGEVKRLRKQARTARFDKGAAACLDPESQGQLARALAQNQPGEVERLRKQAQTAFSDKGAAACLDPESQGQLALARAKGQAGVEADLLAKGRAKRAQTAGTAIKSRRKAPGCKITIAELTPTGGREGECILQSSRDVKNKRFEIKCKANGGVFGYRCFRLIVPDTKSGARADNLGNILNLPPFIIERPKDGRLFECKFTEIIEMANVASTEAGGAEAEAEAVVQ